MEFVQKKGSTKHTFIFKDDFFNFAYKEKSGSGDIDFNYGDLPEKSSVKIEENEWLRNVGYLWCGLGVAFSVYDSYNLAALTINSFWIVTGALCVLWAFFTKVTYTVFQTERGNIYVMKDKKHDAVVDELTARRKKQLLSWYGDINPNNELESEIDKFKWLVKQNVMTDEEANIKIAEVKFNHTNHNNASVQLLN
ncbi:hypothetical protein [Motilimonas pumila]|uniref:Uncharacterized protein n=1 Tax=Motilimonas pumila TaxID=2303987 RepID=A0A418YFW6_9GAMM|nr:hypothetical protein [Motilimonas pumila]RJG48386.1 hypothetical protein D1Z90_07790 [Motilimonas pumila]